MKAYGFTENSDQALQLSELSLALTPEAMRSFAAFVAFAAQEMEQLGSDYDHVHWQDHPTWQEDWPDVQLCKVYANSP
jgi:hypothetical protein